MSEELKPCPLCGGEANVRYFAHDDSECTVMCSNPNCRASVSARSCGSMTTAYNRARKLWNRRAERTCRPEVCDDGAGAWGVYCSECGYRFAGPYGKREVPEHMATRRDIMPRYCSSCGARVVSK